MTGHRVHQGKGHGLGPCVRVIDSQREAKGTSRYYGNKRETGHSYRVEAKPDNA